MSNRKKNFKYSFSGFNRNPFVDLWNIPVHSFPSPGRDFNHLTLINSPLWQTRERTLGIRDKALDLHNLSLIPSTTWFSKALSETTPQQKARSNPSNGPLK